MSLRNRRTAAVAAIGVLAGGVPVGAASAAPGHGASGVPGNVTDLLGAIQPIQPIQHSNDPSHPGADAGGSTSQDDQAGGTASPPLSGDQSGAADCAQAALATTLPTVITCGPVTISFTFNTVTTTTTITTVDAPITAANGPISTPLPNPVTTTITNPITNPVPAITHRCNPARRKKAKTTHPTVHKPVKTGRLVKVSVRFGPRPRR